MMMHSKYQGFRACRIGLDFFLMFPFISLCKVGNNANILGKKRNAAYKD